MSVCCPNPNIRNYGRKLVKRKNPIVILSDGIESENLVLSVQVLGEFFNVVTRHIPHPLTTDEAREIVSAISILPVQEIDLAMMYYWLGVAH